MASGSGVEKDALGSYGTGTNQSAAAYAAIDPKYRQMISNPQGYTPQERANLLTSALQTTGGTTAGAVGAGGLLATRTNNAGGAAAAIDDAAREAGVTNTNAALGVNEQDAALQRQQMLQGLQGEQELYSGGNQAALAALGIANSNQQGNSLWKTLISTAGQVGGAFAGAGG